MEDQQQGHHEIVKKSRIKKIIGTTLAILWYVFGKFMDAAEGNWVIMKRESDLFLGAFFTLLGVFGFHSGKYCDGNTADYLSCTRPTTYYYYGWLEITCIIIGVFLILLWWQKRQNNR